MGIIGVQNPCCFCATDNAQFLVISQPLLLSHMYASSLKRGYIHALEGQGIGIDWWMRFRGSARRAFPKLFIWSLTKTTLEPFLAALIALPDWSTHARTLYQQPHFAQSRSSPPITRSRRHSSREHLSQPNARNPQNGTRLINYRGG